MTPLIRYIYADQLHFYTLQPLSEAFKIDYGGQESWEHRLAKRIALMSFIGIGNMIIGSIVFALNDLLYFSASFAASIPVFVLIIALCRKNHALIGTYLFFIIGFIFLSHLSLGMGKDSMIFTFFFPIVISIVQLLGRNESKVHLMILSTLCALSIIGIAFAYYFGIEYPNLEVSSLRFLPIFNILLSFVTTILFTLIVVNDFLKQEATVNKMLEEKNVLIAEIFHRVKNNLYVVTSLLNLQKSTSDSPEVHAALEECRSRIFSMALVHENLFNTEKVGLDFKVYVEKLVKEIERTFGVNGETHIVIESETLDLSPEKALPWGMILNELITNAHKYGRNEQGALDVNVQLRRENGNVLLAVRDHGKGICNELLEKQDSLGFILIQSLSEQLNGTYIFTNKNGLQFDLSFPLK